MKHLITNNAGGFPFDLDDYRFMEAGFNEDIVSILKAYPYTVQDASLGVPPPYSFIIYGVHTYTATGTLPNGMSYVGTAWTEGAVMIDGIIYKVNARTTPATFTFINPTHAVYFDTSVVNDPAGLENFKNGIPHQTYGIRTATPAVYPIGTSKLAFNEDTPRFLSNIRHVPRGYTSFSPFGSGSLPAFGEGFQDGFNPLQVRKNEIGQVEFKGELKYQFNPGGILGFCSLAQEFAPPQTGHYTICNITTNKPIVIVVAELSGQWFILPSDQAMVSVGDSFSFNGLCFPSK